MTQPPLLPPRRAPLYVPGATGTVWVRYKNGFEVNEHHQLRTCARD